mmetsp:Transcript_29661/g.69314  ORF Transcript_29661/g.69314 Transcript_29661/m.69314 type:complete len:590 (-) Transcript_29661:9-1778(-)
MARVVNVRAPVVRDALQLQFSRLELPRLHARAVLHRLDRLGFRLQPPSRLPNARVPVRPPKARVVLPARVALLTAVPLGGAPVCVLPVLARACTVDFFDPPTQVGRVDLKGQAARAAVDRLDLGKVRWHYPGGEGGAGLLDRVVPVRPSVAARAQCGTGVVAWVPAVLVGRVHSAPCVPRIPNVRRLLVRGGGDVPQGPESVGEGEEAAATCPGHCGGPEKVSEGTAGLCLPPNRLDRVTQPLAQHLCLLRLVVALAQGPFAVESVNVPQRVLHVLVHRRLVLEARRRGEHAVAAALRLVPPHLGSVQNDAANHPHRVRLHLLVNAGADAQQQGYEEAGAHVLHLRGFEVLLERNLLHRLGDLLVCLSVQLLHQRGLNRLHHWRYVRILALPATLGPPEQLLPVARLEIFQGVDETLCVHLLLLLVLNGQEPGRQRQSVLRLPPMSGGTEGTLDLLAVCRLILGRPLVPGVAGIRDVGRLLVPLALRRRMHQQVVVAMSCPLLAGEGRLDACPVQLALEGVQCCLEPLGARPLLQQLPARSSLDAPVVHCGKGHQQQRHRHHAKRSERSPLAGHSGRESPQAEKPPPRV